MYLCDFHLAYYIILRHIIQIVHILVKCLPVVYYNTLQMPTKVLKFSHNEVEELKMSLQAILNKQARDALPRVSELINAATDFERNQMICATDWSILNSPIPLDTMTEIDLLILDSTLVETFHQKGWVK